MTAQILDGKALAKEILSEVKEEITTAKLTPHLAVVICGNDPASEVYVKKKLDACNEVGIKATIHRPTEKGLLLNVMNLNWDKSVHGILVQLPIPKTMDINSVFNTLHPDKDVDGLTPKNIGLLSRGIPKFIPCTALGIQKLLIKYKIPIAGKRICIINRSNVVGRPLHALLTQENPIGGNATVTICHDATPPEDLKSICLQSDIVVVAVGKKDFLTKNMVRFGSVVVDVGITRLSDNKIVGDVHPEVEEVASYISKTPGGVGPLTCACLMHNVLKATKEMKL